MAERVVTELAQHEKLAEEILTERYQVCLCVQTSLVAKLGDSLGGFHVERYAEKVTLDRWFNLMHEGTRIGWHWANSDGTLWPTHLAFG